MGVYRIKDFGAEDDGKTLNTGFIQKAIDICHKAGGGKVACESGCYRTGTLTLKSNVELHIEAGCRLFGSGNLSDYEDLEAEGFIAEQGPEKTKNALIKAADAENIAVTGSGEINGCGLSFYKECKADSTGKFDKPETPRPRMLMFYRCRKILIEDTSFIDSPCWTFWLMQCDNVNIHRIKITGNDMRMRNVDGIDIDACRNVTVSDCIIDTDDDCIAVRSMQKMYKAPAVCEDIAVTNCILKTMCNGIRIGCPGDSVIRNCTFNNLIINGGTGITFQNPKRYLSEGLIGSADVHNISFSNITIDCRHFPVEMYVEEGIELKRLSDISFSGFRIESSDGPCFIQGSRETIIRKVSFSDMNIKTCGENAIVCRLCEGVKFHNIELSNRS